MKEQGGGWKTEMRRKRRWWRSSIELCLSAPSRCLSEWVVVLSLLHPSLLLPPPPVPPFLGSPTTLLSSRWVFFWSIILRFPICLKLQWWHHHPMTLWVNSSHRVTTCQSRRLGPDRVSTTSSFVWMWPNGFTCSRVTEAWSHSSNGFIRACRWVDYSSWNHNHGVATATARGPR